MTKARVFRSKEYKSWYKELTEKEQRIVDTRINTYREFGILTKIKLLHSNYNLFEFKWDSGLRVYFSLIEDCEGKLMLLLIGGNKNTQMRDINKAKNIISKAIKKIGMR
jgi:putative addiction module killer protein